MCFSSICARFLLLFTVVLPMPRALAQNYEAKVEDVRAVFGSLYRAIGTNRSSPTIILRPRLSNGVVPLQRVAWYNRASNQVTIDEETYDLLSKLFSGNADVAISVILSHELGHYYWQHGWAEDFGSRYPDLEVATEAWKVHDAEQLRFNEAQADFTGAFISYLAGYKSFKVAASVYNDIYKEYGIDTNTNSRYPRLDERKEIIAKATQQLSQYVDVFEAGVLTLLIGDYKSSERCFRFIASDFPSREILNNAGVACSLEALYSFDQNDIGKYPQSAYDYPFGFDNQPRLEMYSFVPKISDRQERMIEARRYFERARSSDEKYVPAYVNLSLISSLEGENDFAFAYARKAVEISKDLDIDSVTMANAHIALGIAYANSNSQNAEELASSEFRKAHQANPRVAKLNAAILKHDRKAKYHQKAEEVAGIEREALENVNPNIYEMPETSNESKCLKRWLPKIGDEVPEVTITSTVLASHEGNATTKQIKVMTIVTQASRINVARTLPDYKGSSKRGVAIGDDVNVVEKAYGEPVSVISARQHTYYLYEKAQIIFEIDAKQKVDGWILYCKHNRK